MSSTGNKLKVLIISQFYYPDVTACAFRMHETAQLLAKMGCEVHVIAGEPHKGKVGDNKTDDEQIKVSRVKLINYEGGGKWNYIAHYLSFMFGAIKASARHRGKFDIIWASSPPLFTAIAGLVVSWFKKAPLCLDIRDIWPESAVVAGQIKENSLLFKCAKVVEYLLYRAAKHITCVAKPMADYLEKLSGGKKPTVIYNAIPASMLSDEALAIEQNPEKIDILYIGNMGYCQNLGLVVEAAKLLEQKGEKRIKFKLVGGGVEKPMLEAAIKAANLNNLEILGLVSKEEAVEMIRKSHALMLHLKDDGTMDKTIPSKVFDYMAGGRPILFGLKGEACDILGSIEGNLYYDPANPTSLADQAEFLLKNYSKLATSATQNLVEVKNNYLRDTMAKKLFALFESIISK